MPTATKYWMVECRYLGGWGDAEWLEDDKPMRFPTKEVAEEAIDDFIQESVEAELSGFMEDAYDRADYRAVEERPYV